MSTENEVVSYVLLSRQHSGMLLYNVFLVCYNFVPDERSVQKAAHSREARAATGKPEHVTKALMSLR